MFQQIHPDHAFVNFSIDRLLLKCLHDIYILALWLGLQTNMLSVLLLIQHYVINKRAQSLTIRYIRTKKPFSLQSTLIILILIAILPLTFIDGTNIFIFFSIPIILSLLFQLLLKPLFAPVEFWGSVANFLRIWAILQSILMITGMLTYDLFQDSGIFHTHFGEIKLTQIVFTICNTIGGGFYIQFTILIIYGGTS